MAVKTAMAWSVAASAAFGWAQAGEDARQKPAAPAKTVTFAKLTAALFGSGPAAAPAAAVEASGGAAAKPAYKTTHEQTRVVAIPSLQAICLNPATDQVVALAGPGRYTQIAKNMVGEVMLLNADGSTEKSWKLDFVGQAINCAANGDIYVAGDGVIAKFGKDGAMLHRGEAPHLAQLTKDKANLAKLAEQRRSQSIATYKPLVQQLKQQVKASKTPDKGEKFEYKDEDGNKIEYTQPSLNQQLKQYEQVIAAAEKKTVKEYEAELLANLRRINAIAVSGKDVFVTTGEAKGYGYSVWRTDLKLQNPKVVLSGLRGCCGQMDVQCCGELLAVAQNTDKAVGLYDRDGKKVKSFGKAGREGDGETFGSCCNPMNTRPCGNGDIFTSESEGYVKRFDANGKFVELAAVAKIPGGCKNVPIAASADGNRIYVADVTGGKLLVMARKKPAVAAAR